MITLIVILLRLPPLVLT
ncbi:hypothetical protein CGLO_02921 [Colletotrichum gloeosporioides Cg-14]|uniref:Uncharacterized protein n=1 Tax=Colletotrichum gloeosporioides (strain Cg-14) TaxID=1237896 RepID=T0LZQ3_COLGC|nr:hypothetical protein CGLO_02921 [Colletotrichum gloeosporioides Cg-14]